MFTLKIICLFKVPQELNRILEDEDYETTIGSQGLRYWTNMSISYTKENYQFGLVFTGLLFLNKIETKVILNYNCKDKLGTVELLQIEFKRGEVTFTSTCLTIKKACFELEIATTRSSSSKFKTRFF